MNQTLKLTDIGLNDEGGLDYISWSRMQTFLNSKSTYTDRYIYKKPQFETKEMRFWKTFHELMEIATPDFLKEYDGGISELDCRESLECIGRPDIIVRSIVDKIIDDKVIEFKTGKKAWTREMAENHWQLYLEHFALHGLQEWEAELVWVPTKEVNGEIELTEEKYVYKVQITTEKKLEWLNKLAEVYDNIIYFHNNLGAIDLRAEKRWELMQQLEAVKQEIEELDNSVVEDLRAGKSVTCDFGAYHLTTKTTAKLNPKNQDEKDEVLKLQDELIWVQKDLDEKLKEFQWSPLIVSLEAQAENIKKKLKDYSDITEIKTAVFRKKSSK